MHTSVKNWLPFFSTNGSVLGAYQNFFFANFKAVRDIFLFLCLFKNDHKSTEKMEDLIKVSL